MIFYLHQIDLVNKAMAYAIKAHADVNQLYGKSIPYAYHLACVANNGWRFIHLLPEKDRAIAIAVCYTHDLIEDARQTYNDVMKATNKDVAEATILVTSYSRGINRAERMPDWVYKEIASSDIATFVKICDRIANMENSKLEGSGMYGKYIREYPHFKKMLYKKEFNSMFEYIDSILDVHLEVINPDAIKNSLYGKIT